MPAWVSSGSGHCAPRGSSSDAGSTRSTCNERWGAVISTSRRDRAIGHETRRADGPYAADGPYDGARARSAARAMTGQAELGAVPKVGSIWRDGRLWMMAAYGFVAGLPLSLSTFTLRYWLSESGATLSVIGLTANIGLAYSLKFLWSPVFDQMRPPGGTRRLGRRRGWLAVIQPALAIAAAMLALTNPAASPLSSIAAAALVAFLSASQDIAIDAWRIETFDQRQQGKALAAYVWGYRIALLVATSGVIWASGLVGWHWALLGVAVLLLLGPVVTLLAPEPVADGAP